MDNLKSERGGGGGGGGGEDGGIEEILRNALRRLRRMDSYEGYLDYIRSEWYSSVSDLLLALEDGKAWSDLKLPGRLKLEIKSELLGVQVSRKDNMTKNEFKNDAKNEAKNESFKTEIIKNAATAPMTPLVVKAEQWTKYFSSEHNAFFYYSADTNITQWEEPTGNVDIITYISATNSPAMTEHSADDFESKSDSKIGEQSEIKECYGDHFEKEHSELDLAVTACPSYDSAAQSQTKISEFHTKTDKKSLPLDSVTAGKSMKETNNTINQRIFFAEPSPSYIEECIPSAFVVNDAYAVNGPVPIGIPILNDDVSDMNNRSSFSNINGRSSFTSFTSIGSRASIGSIDDHDILINSESLDYNDHIDNADEGDDDGEPDERLISRLADMGFSIEAATAALRRSGNNLPAAASLLLLNPPAYEATIPASGPRSTATGGPTGVGGGMAVASVESLKQEKPKIVPPKNNYAPRVKVHQIGTIRPSAPMLPPPAVPSSHSL